MLHCGVDIYFLLVILNTVAVCFIIAAYSYDSLLCDIQSHCVCMEYTLAMNSFNSLNVFELVLNYLYLLNISLWVSNFSCPCLSLIVLLQDEYTYYLHESIIVFCNHKLIGFWVCL